MQTRITTLDLPSFARSTIGFDRLFNEIERSLPGTANTYPPYTIAKISDDEYVISLAVAGFAMDNLDITKDKNVLRIEGASPKVSEEVQYLHKGIGARQFRREFTLADHVEVKSATLELGMLNIQLVREVPAELQPKRIEITTSTVIEQR